MTVLISFIPFLFMAFYFRIIFRGSTSVRLEINWGERCWNCHTKFQTDEFPSEKNLKLCKSCDRHIKISSIRSRFLKNTFILKKIIVSDSFRKITNYLVFLNLFFLAIYVFSTVFTSKYNLFFNIVTTFLNCLFWILLILQDKFTSIKKPSTK